MAGKYGEHNKVRCSFCNKSEDQVRKLIAGPEGVYICDECIEICAEIIDEELDEYYEQDEKQSGINLMKPKEITAFLDDYVIGQDEAKRPWLWPSIIIIKELPSASAWTAWSCRRAIF